jgi:hypothetical protein
MTFPPLRWVADPRTPASRQAHRPDAGTMSPSARCVPSLDTGLRWTWVDRRWLAEYRTVYGRVGLKRRPKKDAIVSGDASQQVLARAGATKVAGQEDLEIAPEDTDRVIQRVRVAQQQGVHDWGHLCQPVACGGKADPSFWAHVLTARCDAPEINRPTDRIPATLTRRWAECASDRPAFRCAGQVWPGCTREGQASAEDRGVRA